MTARSGGGRSLRGRLGAWAVTVLAALVASVVMLAAPAPGAPADGPSAPRGYLGTAALPVCSAALVRWPASRPEDPARVLTNGHCVRFPFLGPREVLLDRPAWKAVRLLDAAGATVLGVRAVRLEYATMRRTDVGLYRLRETYAELEARGVEALTVTDRRPPGRQRVTIPSAYHERTLGCGTHGLAPVLRERVWTWRDALRLPTDRGCRLVPGFSGSPVLDAAGTVVAIANTAFVPGGRPCVDTACERRDGRRVVRPRIGYAQQVWELATCLDADRSFDVALPGCRLPAPR